MLLNHATEPHTTSKSKPSIQSIEANKVIAIGLEQAVILLTVNEQRTTGTRWCLQPGVSVSLHTLAQETGSIEIASTDKASLIMEETKSYTYWLVPIPTTSDYFKHTCLNFCYVESR